MKLAHPGKLKDRCISIHQNKRTNKLLIYAAERLVDKGLGWCLPVVDILLSLFLEHNKADRATRQAIKKDKSAFFMVDVKFNVSLSSIVERVYPKGSVRTHLRRSRTAWICRFIEALDILAEEHVIITGFEIEELEDGSLSDSLTLYYHISMTKVRDVEQPSPLNLPYRLYHFQTGRNKIPTYAFMLHRALYLNYKMNCNGEFKAGSMSIADVCRMADIPLPTQYVTSSTRPWHEGVQVWFKRCIQRALRYFGIFTATLNGDHKTMMIGPKAYHTPQGPTFRLW